MTIYFKSCFIAILSLFSLTISNAQPYTDSDIINLLSTAGEVHNDGLDYIYNQLVNKYGASYTRINSQQNHDELHSDIDQFTKDFFKSTTQLQNIDIDAIIKDNRVSIDRLQSSNTDIVGAIRTSPKYSNLSQNFVSLMGTLDQLFQATTPKADYEAFLTSNISSLTSENEKIMFAAAVRVAFGTQNYWAQNISKWESFFSTYKTAFTNKITNSTCDGYSIEGIKSEYSEYGLLSTRRLFFQRAYDIGKKDVAGVVVGGVAGCISGAAGATFVLPIVGTVAGCAGVGAVGALTGGALASATAVVENFIDWLTNH